MILQLCRWELEGGCHAAAHSPPSRAKRKFPKSNWLVMAKVNRIDSIRKWHEMMSDTETITSSLRRALLPEELRKRSSNIPPAVFSFILWKESRVSEAPNRGSRVIKSFVYVSVFCEHLDRWPFRLSQGILEKLLSKENRVLEVWTGRKKRLDQCR